MDPYINLSNAIVFQGGARLSQGCSMIEAEPFNYMAKKDITQIERFIKSEWFEMISDIDPMTLIRHLHRRWRMDKQNLRKLTKKYKELKCLVDRN